LGEPLTRGRDEPDDALALRPRDVEGELHPRLSADDLRRGASRGAAVREELPGLDVGDRFRLVGIEDSARLVYAGLRQLVWVLLGATSLAAAHVLDLRGEMRAAKGALVAAGVSGLMLVLSMLQTRSRRR
jgi:hypothetical protein